MHSILRVIEAQVAMIYIYKYIYTNKMTVLFCCVLAGCDSYRLERSREDCA